MTSANIKMMRAQEHLESFEDELKLFRESTECPLVRQCDLETHKQVWVVDADLAIPSHRFSLYIGDMLYNTRAALDHLVWDLVLSCGNEPDDRNAFPLYNNPAHWRRGKGSKLGGIADPKIRAEIRDCQPCFGTNPFRNRHLALLEELSNTDKHRRFNLTTAAVDGGFVRGSPETEITHDTVFIHEGSMERGTVLASMPSEHVDVEFLPAKGVAFRDGMAAGESAYQVLIAIREVTRMTLDRFQPFLPRIVYI